MANVPTTAYPFFHSCNLQTRFNDFDPLGHMNNSMYFQFMDLGKIEYIRDVLGDTFSFKRDAMVIVNVNCDFCRPTVMGEPLQALTRVDSIAEHSFVFEQRIINSDTREIKAIARTVMVGFNVEYDVKLRIPDAWRERISAFEHRQI